MKILIVCQTINDQVQFLTGELEKMNFNVEVTDSLHPLRMLFNKYDLIHFIHNDPHIDLKTVLSAWSARTLGTATLFTTYCRLEPGFLQDFEFNYFDAMTLPFISELKKMRFFHGQKLILPSFPDIQFPLKKLTSGPTQSQYIFSVVKSFDDLLKINFSSLTFLKDQPQIYVDAHLLRMQKPYKKSSDLRRGWTAFVKKHPEFANFKLFTEPSTLMDVLQTGYSYTFIHHLDLTSEQVAFWMQTAILYNNFLVLHEDQGTGFSNFWKTEKNCLIYSPRQSASVQYYEMNKFLENHKSPAPLTFDFRNSLDLKLNELARLYTKIVSQRASLMQPDSAKM